MLLTLKAAHLNNWLRGLTFLNGSAVSPASLAMLTFKPTYSILCGLSVIAPLAHPPPQPPGFSPAGSFVAVHCCCGLPGSRQFWMVAAVPLLAGSSGVQHRSSWTSAVTSPQDQSLGLALLVSCTVHGACRRNFVYTAGAIPSMLTAVLLFPPC